MFASDSSLLEAVAGRGQLRVNSPSRSLFVARVYAAVVVFVAIRSSRQERHSLSQKIQGIDFNFFVDKVAPVSFVTTVSAVDRCRLVILLPLVLLILIVLIIYNPNV